MQQPKRILFVCVENAGRNQLAEEFFCKYTPPGYEPQSADTEPVDQIHSSSKLWPKYASKLRRKNQR